jgi:hypothetical protein
MTRAGASDGDGGAAADGGVRIPRLRHPVRIVAFLIVLAVLLAGAFVAGRFVTSPTDEALRGASATVPVTATVDRRVVSPGYALPAALSGGTTFDVTVTEASVQESSTAAPPSGDHDRCRGCRLVRCRLGRRLLGRGGLDRTRRRDQRLRRRR